MYTSQTNREIKNRNSKNRTISQEILATNSRDRKMETREHAEDEDLKEIAEKYPWNNLETREETEIVKEDYEEVDIQDLLEAIQQTLQEQEEKTTRENQTKQDETKEESQKEQEKTREDNEKEIDSEEKSDTGDGDYKEEEAWRQEEATREDRESEENLREKAENQQDEAGIGNREETRQDENHEKGKAYEREAAGEERIEREGEAKEEIREISEYETTIKSSLIHGEEYKYIYIPRETMLELSHGERGIVEAQHENLTIPAIYNPERTRQYLRIDIPKQYSSEYETDREYTFKITFYPEQEYAKKMTEQLNQYLDEHQVKAKLRVEQDHLILEAGQQQYNLGQYWITQASGKFGEQSRKIINLDFQIADRPFRISYNGEQ